MLDDEENGDWEREDDEDDRDEGDEAPQAGAAPALVVGVPAGHGHVERGPGAAGVAALGLLGRGAAPLLDVGHADAARRGAVGTN